MNPARILHLARRAISASPAELKTRLQQAVFAAHNFVASQRGGSALSQRGHLRSLKLPNNDVGAWWQLRDRDWFGRLDWQSLLPADGAAAGLPWILQQADLVVGDRMPLFSYDDIEFVGKDRWHRDFVLNKTSPRKFYGHVKYLDVEQVGDSKHVWEPNRFGWALWLGIAWSTTSDPTYLNKFVELTEDWFEQNPYPMGINYCSSLEVAFRNYAWLWSLRFFGDQLAKEHPQLLEKIVQGIWIGCHHIEQNLSTYFAPNTHIIGEGFGLFACGAAFPEFAESKHWRETGMSILRDEARKQFHYDGTHRELSSGYHLYSTDFYTHAVLVGRWTGFALPQPLVDVTRRMLVRLADLAQLDLRLPQFNDCDGGRLMSLVPESLDAGPTLMAGEYLFDDLSLVALDQPVRGYPLLTGHVAPHEDATLRKRAEMPMDRDLHRLYDSGIATYKTWAGDYVALRATPFGYDECAHSHDAALGILATLKGIPVFVDSGIGSYTQSLECRNAYRSATGKNTILVDGDGPSVPKGWFDWKRRTDCELVAVRRFRDGFSARGVHAGFSDCNGRHALVERELILLDAGIVVIVDRWDANEEVSIESRFTINPSLLVDPDQQSISHPEQVVYFSASLLNGGEQIEISHNEHPYSSNYGHVSVTKSLSFKAPPSCRGGLVTVFSRIGKIDRTKQDEFRFQDDEIGILLALTQDGVTPRRTESHQDLVEKVK